MIFWPGGTIRSDLYKSLRMADFRLHLFSFYHERNRRFDDPKMDSLYKGKEDEMIFWPGGQICRKDISLGSLEVANHRVMLFSFFYEKRLRIDKAEDTLHGFRFFADSGAFSAWTKGEIIDFEEYLAFLHYHIGYLEAYAALDAIPTSTQPAALEQAAAMSWVNYQDMLKDGLEPIPVYHYGESRKWLDNLLGSGCTYIGLGGMGNANRRERTAWLDSVFHDLPDNIKVHGFGVSAINLLFRYPWYSADSTTWRLAANNGNIFIPLHNGSQFLFDRPPYLVHTRELLGRQDEAVDAWLGIVGTDRQQLFDDYRHRGACNAVFMREVTAHHAENGPKKRSSIQQGFFK